MIKFLKSTQETVRIFQENVHFKKYKKMFYLNNKFKKGKI